MGWGGGVALYHGGYSIHKAFSMRVKRRGGGVLLSLFFLFRHVLKNSYHILHMHILHSRKCFMNILCV